MDFTQSGEQAHIEAWAARRRPGRFLDLGAFDGETGSNTRWLAITGWTGVLVEPAALAFHQLAELYADRSADILCVQALIEQRPGLHPFWYAPGDLVSTTDEGQHAVWQHEARFIPSLVAAVTLEHLLAAVEPGFAFVSIDTEGSSLEVLRDLRAHRSWSSVEFLVVEFTDGEQEPEIVAICGGGWRVLERTSNNVVLERL